MVTRRRGQTIRVTGPGNRTIDVKFFDDGGVRCRFNEAGPMVIRYAFLPGIGQEVVVELTPTAGSSWLQTTG
jgi:hypothetical protein